MKRWTILILSLIASLVVVSWLSRDSTIYAPGYSWSKFSSIRNGMTQGEVTRVLGQPLSIESFNGEIHWGYPPLADSPKPVASIGDPISPIASADADFVADLSGRVIGVHRYGIKPQAEGMVEKSLDDVRKRYGEPPIAYTIPRQTMYWYSKLRNIKGEYVMLIHFDEAGKAYQIDAHRIGHYLSTPGEHRRHSSLLEWLEWYVF